MDTLHHSEPTQNESQDTIMSEVRQATEVILIEPTAPYGNEFVAPVAIMTSDLHIAPYQTGSNSFSPAVNTTEDDFYSERFALSPVIWIRSSAEDHYSERFALSPVDRGSSSAENDYSDSSSDDYPERFALSPVDDGTQHGHDSGNDKTPSDDRRNKSNALPNKETCATETSTVRDTIDSAKSQQTAEEALPTEPKLRRSTRTKKEVNYNLGTESEDETDHE